MIALPDPADWLDYEKRVGFLPAEFRDRFPDFLGVSPARTGTTWLQKNLQCHPQIHVRPEKEVRYFDSRWRRHDFHWYCELFNHQQGQLAGDISPSYSLLPSVAIRHIAVLKPDLKIVFLLREPIDRAWSHLKHTIVYGEANFASYPPGATVRVSLNELVQNVVHDYTLTSGDYESIIRRWMSHFPPSQIHVAFFEEATARPEQYFATLFRFLGADPITSFKDFPLDKKQNPTRLPWEMPNELTPWVDRLYRTRRKRLERLLQSTFGLTDPWPVLPAQRYHAGLLRLPDIPGAPEGWIIALGDGWFQGRHAKDVNSNDVQIVGRPSDSPRAEFLFDLLEKLGAHNTEADNASRSARLSVEDRRLARQLDTIAHSASGPI